MEKSKKIKEQFDALYSEWEKVIQDPKIQVSSIPQDYIDSEPYSKIMELGEDVLPFILEKIEQGVFFMNQAALAITKRNINDIIKEEKKKPLNKRINFFAVKKAEEMPEFLSEQQKSKLILKYLHSQEE